MVSHNNAKQSVYTKKKEMGKHSKEQLKTEK